MTLRSLIGAALLVCVAQGMASAQTVVEALGAVTVAGGDEAQTRQRALDDALRRAVSQSLEAMVDPKVLKAHAELYKKRILRQAQRYVTTFRVRDEGEAEGVYHIHIDGTMDLAALRRDVDALGSPAPATEPVSTAAAAPVRPSLVLLAVANDGQTSSSTFGQQGRAGRTEDALKDALAEFGFDILYAQGVAVPVIAQADSPSSGLPVTDAQAIALAKSVGAGGAIVARIAAPLETTIRATSWVGSEREIALRVLDLASPWEPVASVVAAEGAAGPDAAFAMRAATQAVIRHVSTRVGPRLASRWPAALPSDLLALRVYGVARWSDMTALIRGLRSLPGVGEVTLWRATRREITLKLRSDLAPETVAAGVLQTVLSGRRVSVLSASRATGVTVELGELESTIPPIEAP